MVHRRYGLKTVVVQHCDGFPSMLVSGMPPGPAMAFEGGLAFSSALVRMFAKLGRSISSWSISWWSVMARLTAVLGDQRYNR